MTWRDDFERVVGETIISAERVTGGSINHAYRVTLDNGDPVFVKTHPSPPSGMFDDEAEDLRLLGQANLGNELLVPGVFGSDESFLALTWLDLDSAFSDEDFGRGLAHTHAMEQHSVRSHPFFGGRDNFLATLPQQGYCLSIAELYCEHRLRPVLQRLEPSTLNKQLREKIDKLRARPELFGPVEKPAFLHGDLWSGNVSGYKGKPVIFDPACYWGHREIDLAMLQLFGSISSRFVDAYSEVWPLDKAWRERTSLWQLYPIAVHAILFGGGYVRQLLSTFDDVLA
ncbi:MAG TPA: fructosamine kinase family protein [Kofleriaceae bacterium]|jgi:fructosamine-3-kinase